MEGGAGIWHTVRFAFCRLGLGPRVRAAGKGRLHRLSPDFGVPRVAGSALEAKAPPGRGLRLGGASPGAAREGVSFHMASSNSARKRVRQNAKRASRNHWRLRTLRAALKDLQDKLLHGGYEETQASFRKACQLLDKTAGKGVIHKNTAARRKSRLSVKVLAKKSAK